MISNHTEAQGGIIECDDDKEPVLLVPGGFSVDDKTLKFYGAPLLHELNNTGKVNNDTKRH